ncbi:MAG: type IX secretion system membrane protein PorP/SprF [Saprospiraceae bacterium]|nr:type IX secretion system membrane protein PorP/SprF [Saprospiraceae bacterium]
MAYLYRIVFFLLLGSVSLQAQQEPMYTQFMFGKMLYNPGYAGSFESPTLLAVYRNQWIGLEGAPKTIALSYNQPLLNNRVGVGGNLVRNSVGINKTITIDIAYAYRIALRRGYLGIGLQASMRHMFQDWTDSRLVTTQPIGIDGAVPGEAKSKLLPNFGFGIFYTGPKWFAGLAAPRLVSNNIDFAEQGGVLSREVQHFNAMAGVSFDLGEEMEITPQLLMKYAIGAPFDVDVNVMGSYQRKFYLGATYRTGGDSGGAGESIDALFGIQATKNLFFALSYDIGLTKLRTYNNGSIEATARWWFTPPEGEEVINPNRPW